MAFLTFIQHHSKVQERKGGKKSRRGIIESFF